MTVRPRLRLVTADPSRRHAPVRATRTPDVDLEAVTAALPADPWRALLLASLELTDALQGVVAYDGADVRRRELVTEVHARLTALVLAASEVV